MSGADPAVNKLIMAASGALAELDAVTGLPPIFRDELATLLTKVQTAQGNNVALAEKTKTLQHELDSARRLHSELKNEEEELVLAVKQMTEETGRLSEEANKARAMLHDTEKHVADSKAHIASLQAEKELGSGWTSDQARQRDTLETALNKVMAELNAKRSHAAVLRQEVALLMAHCENAQAEKTEADKTQTALKADLAAVRAQVAALLRTKEHKDAKVSELSEVVQQLNAQVKERTKGAENGAAELVSAKDALKRDKASLDRYVKDYERLASKALTLAQDLDRQTENNIALAAQLQELEASIVSRNAETARIKKESARTTKLQELALEKVKELDGKIATAETAKAEAQRKVQDLQGQVEAERKRMDSKKQQLDNVVAEKDVLQKGLGKAGDKRSAAAAAVQSQEHTLKHLQTEIAGYINSVRRLREEIDALQEARARVAGEAEEAAQAYFTAVEGLKLQDLQVAAIQKRIAEADTKLKQQQALYEAVKADRANYNKQLSGAHEELSEMKRHFKNSSRRIEALKSEITGKDQALVKEHFEHHRVEKEKELLRADVTRLHKQVQACEHILANQETEASKLQSIVKEADEEYGRQRKEVEAVTAERQLLTTQLQKRDGELTALYEKLRVQKSLLASGAAEYAQKVAERDQLAAGIASLKGELLLAQTQVNDTGALEAECNKLESDLMTEKSKIRALTDEMDRPLNLHRWRALQDRDPEKWGLIQRMHALQKRLLETRDAVKERETAIQAKEREFADVKASVSKVPGEEAAEAIATLQGQMKEKAKAVKNLEAEIIKYRTECDDYKRELQRCEEAMERLTQQYLKQAKAKRRQTAPPGALAAAAAANAAAGLNLSALDMSAVDNLPAAGGAGGGTGRGAGRSSTAVKAEADQLLARYADLVGGDSKLADIAEEEGKKVEAEGKETG